MLQSPSSRRHSNAEPPTAEKTKVARVERAPVVGPESNEISGAAVSTLQVRSAGVGSALPAPSRLRARRTCSPSPSSSRSTVGVQASQSPESSRHSNVEPASVDVRVRRALALRSSPDGPESMAVSGACVSTVQVRSAGVGSTLPTASPRADPEDVRSLCLGWVSVCGEVQAVHCCGVVQPALERGARARGRPGPTWPRRLPPDRTAPTRSTCRGTLPASTAQVRSAGVASTFPAASRARTAKG